VDPFEWREGALRCSPLMADGGGGPPATGSRHEAWGGGKGRHCTLLLRKNGTGTKGAMMARKSPF
jgi:hypothetical protein